MTVTSYLSGLAGALRERSHPYWGALRAELQVVPELLAGALPLYVKTLLLANPTLLSLVRSNAEADPYGLALQMDAEQLSWQSLEALTSRVAHALADAGLRAGQVVALLGRNSPRYVGLLLGATRLGATTALVNHNLRGAPLAHALNKSGARLVLCEEPLAALLSELALPDLRVMRYGSEQSELDAQLRRAPTTAYPPARVDKDDDFVYIYTSGTTGLPKPCRVTHARALGAGVVLGKALFDFQPGDKLYAPLPLYHSSALLIGLATAIAYRVPTALRDTFSATALLADVRRYDATALLYIGEMCRYLLATPPAPTDRQHRLRIAVGNGLRPEIWDRFRDRFGIAQVHEFYAATEAPGLLVNLSGVAGAVGRLPLGGLGMYRLARYDVDREELVRDARGYCVTPAVDEPGELLIKILDFRLLSGLSYRGYTDERASSEKVVTDAFSRGDRYFRTGDLLRCDALGFCSFVDRIGDTFRCKGENVSSSEVASVLSRAPGIGEVAVLGVRLRGLDGQYGLAAVVCQGALDADGFFRTAQELPSYAQPRFVRILPELPTTSTHKHQKARLKKEGVDPQQVRDPLYVRQGSTYVPLTPAYYQQILSGATRL
jgi:acyl-CoA synthetase (AMP-forming)/AMP-acid ligase II